ncbi:hypothetical protein NDR87_11305 [Nocardia sp. CDC159]|uniref:Uncharacterized protein n=1 Tax=Nocardia pulmonis TaxID=2951408 RepID=A0A9X2E4G2_9NOCA|nr:MULTISPECIES: hypothetical protein [Nocardia]MCM6774059.1 hypothetical protein [Nocardia pulmonis]MCM6786946.1 hypothetical protein [Nocardia sp. CDC159]
MIKPTLGLLVVVAGLTGCSYGPDNPSTAQAIAAVPSTTTTPVSDGDRAFLSSLGVKGGGLARLAITSPYGAISTGHNLAEEFERLVNTGMAPAQAFPALVDNFVHGDGFDQDSMTAAEVADLVRLAVGIYKPQYSIDVS